MTSLSVGSSLRASPTLEVDSKDLHFQFTALYPNDSRSRFSLRIVNIQNAPGQDESSSPVWMSDEDALRLNLFNPDWMSVRHDLQTRVVVDMADVEPQQVFDCKANTLGILFLIGVQERVNDKTNHITRVFKREDVEGQCMLWTPGEIDVVPETLTQNELDQAIADARNLEID